MSTVLYACLSAYTRFKIQEMNQIEIYQTCIENLTIARYRAAQTENAKSVISSRTIAVIQCGP